MYITYLISVQSIVLWCLFFHYREQPFWKAIIPYYNTWIISGLAERKKLGKVLVVLQVLMTVLFIASYTKLFRVALMARESYFLAYSSSYSAMVLQASGALYWLIAALVVGVVAIVFLSMMYYNLCKLNEIHPAWVIGFLLCSIIPLIVLMQKDKVYIPGKGLVERKKVSI